MADTGFKFPGTADGAFIGFNAAWTTPDNIKADDDNNAIGSWEEPLDTGTDYLAGSNFDFSAVPAGATIDGIEIRLGKFGGIGGGAWIVVRLIDQTSVLAGDNVQADFTDPLISDVTEESGGATSLFGLTPTRANVQDVDWGMGCRVDNGTGSVVVHIDFMQMKVYYTEGGPFPYHALLPRKRSMNALMTL